MVKVPHTSIDAQPAWSARILNATPPPLLVWLVAGLMVVATAVLDQVTTAGVDVSIFYLMPVLVVTWYESLAEGLAAALLTAVVWFSVDQVSGVIYANAAFHWWNAAVRLAFFLVSALLLSEVKASHQREVQASRLDPLTGVANPRYFDERAYLALAEMRRTGKPLTSVFIDLDDFKGVNDTYGHRVGDAALRAVAEALLGRVRETDVVARLGGDEFCLLLVGADVEEAESVLEDIRVRAATALGSVPISLTIGAMTFEDPPANVDELVNLADALMYRGKSEGKNRTLVGVWREPPRMTA